LIFPLRLTFHQPSFANYIVSMASPPPTLGAQSTSPTEKASVAEMTTPATDVEMASSMSGSEDASPPPNRPNQPKMTPRAIGKRRRRNASRAVKKSLQGQHSPPSLSNVTGPVLSQYANQWQELAHHVLTHHLTTY